MLFSTKSLKNLFFLLLPLSLLAMEPTVVVQQASSAAAAAVGAEPILPPVTDKTGCVVKFEWHKKGVGSLKQTLNPNLEKQIARVFAEAFADITRDFLLDASFQIKPEYAEAVKSLSPAERRELEAQIELAKISRDVRVEQLRQGVLQDGGDDDDAAENKTIVIARNESNDVLGFAVFVAQSAGSVELDYLAIAPEAQGK